MVPTLANVRSLFCVRLPEVNIGEEDPYPIREALLRENFFLSGIARKGGGRPLPEFDKVTHPRASKATQKGPECRLGWEEEEGVTMETNKHVKIVLLWIL